MTTAWLVVWLWSNCGYNQFPLCGGGETGCYCELRHQVFNNALEAGKRAGGFAPYSYVVEVSTPMAPDPDFLEKVKAIKAEEKAR